MRQIDENNLHYIIYELTYISSSLVGHVVGRELFCE